MQSIFELAVIISAVDRASKVADTVGKAIGGIGAASDKLKSTGQSLAVQGALVDGAAQKITGWMDAILAPAAKVEDALAKVQSVITPLDGNMAASMERQRVAALDWSKQHTASAAQFADTTYMMISAGLDEKAAIEATRTAMSVATATMGDNVATAALVATVYNNMGDHTKDVGKEMAHLGDIITKTQQTFQFENLGVLNEGLKFGIPTALQYGVQLDSLSAIIGQLNNAGIQGGMAGTAFAATMKGMQGASEKLGFSISRTSDGGFDFIGTLKGLEAKFGTLKSMSPEVLEGFKDAFGDEGFRGLSLMIGKSAELEANLGKVRDNSQAAAKATAIIEATKTSQLQIMANTLDAAKVTLATQLNPLLTQLIPKVVEMAKAFGDFAAKHPGLTKIMLSMLAIVGGVLSVIGPMLLFTGSISLFAGHAMGFAAGAWKMVTGMWGFVSSVIAGESAAAAFAMTLLANPITWIVLAIVAAAALIYVYWDPIKAFFVQLWDGISMSFTNSWAAISAAWSAFHPLEWIKTTFASVTAWFAGFSLFDAGANIVSTIADGIMAGASKAVAAMKSVVTSVRAYLPFSPAKEGPLKDLHRVRLVETIADAVRPDSLVARMRSVTAAVAAVPLVMAPMAAAALPSAASVIGAGRGAAGGQVVMHVTIQIEGNADASTVEQLDRWVRGNGAVLVDVVDREARRRKRTELG
jgi:TP901 family phage tail tape measure protein